MSYIKKETALQIIDNYAKTVTADGKVVVDAVRDIVDVITPTADVVEVVRCKDCKHCTLTADGEYNPRDIVCVYFMTDGLDANDFCSHGERRENAIT